MIFGILYLIAVLMVGAVNGALFAFLIMENQHKKSRSKKHNGRSKV